MRDVEECVITGPGDRVKVAQAIIEKMIADSWEEGADGNVTIVEEVIPCAYKAGAIIGPGGNTIRNIRETTGVAVDIERGANGCRASDLCRVVGTPAQVKKAIEIIQKATPHSSEPPSPLDVDRAVCRRIMWRRSLCQ